MDTLALIRLGGVGAYGRGRNLREAVENVVTAYVRDFANGWEIHGNPVRVAVYKVTEDVSWDERDVWEGDRTVPIEGVIDLKLPELPSRVKRNGTKYRGLVNEYVARVDLKVKAIEGVA